MQPDTKKREFDIVQSTYMHISLIDQIKACFRREEFKQLLFEENFHVCVPGVYKRFCCGELFRKNALYKQNTNALQIILGFDDFCIVDPLGAAATTHKITAIYARFGNLPSSLQSKVNNILLLSLIFADELNAKETDFNEAWELIQYEVKQIESVGIDIDGIVVKGSIAYLCHDNLGGNVGLLLAKGFNAAYYCRICLLSAEECQNTTHEISHKIRTRQSYEMDLKTIAESEKVVYKETHGVERYCILNNLKYFHIFENLSADIMHDICEGTIPFILQRLFQLIIRKKICSEDELNRRFSVHDYGNLANTPAPINLKRACLGQTAAKSLCLFLNTPLVLYHLRHDRDIKKIWPCVTSLIEIIHIVFSTEINNSDLDRLQSVVGFHLAELKKAGFKLIPKHHFMTHYKRIIEQMGPLVYMSMWSFEHKHQCLKAYAADCYNFKNILKTMAIKHQQMMSHQGMQLHNTVDHGPCEALDASFISELNDLPFTNAMDHIQVVAWLQCNMYRYKEGSIIIHDNAVMKLYKILLIDGEFSFVCYKFRIIEIDAFSQAMVVTLDDPPEQVNFQFQSFSHKNVYHACDIDGRTFITFDNMCMRRLG